MGPQRIKPAARTKAPVVCDLPFRQKLAKPQELCFDWMPRVADGDMSRHARESVP